MVRGIWCAASRAAQKRRTASVVTPPALVRSATMQATMDFALTKGFVFTEPDLRAAVATFPDNPTIDQLRDTWKVAKGARST